ncbi:hypothetical protein HDU80_009748 [Chytriomyces hyalinus]|nr:hypothetical protein HDU80_009748 [Chytriomyces hyalinus]
MPFATEQLDSAIQSVRDNTPKLHFQRQVSHWIGDSDAPAFADDRTEKLDVRGLLLSNPRNMDSELRFHKELFSKLKFNFLEQTTKETFIKRALAQPPQMCQTNEINESETRIRALKSDLKKYKRETEKEQERLSCLIGQVVQEHEHLIKSSALAEEVRDRIDPLETEIATLLQSFDPEKKTLSELLAMNEKMRVPVQELQIRVQELNRKLEQTAELKQKRIMENNEARATLNALRTKVAEAKQTIQLRDPNMDQYLIWCQHWTSKLLELQGIQSVVAVNTHTLHITFDTLLTPSSNLPRGSIILCLEINTASGVFRKRHISGTLQNSKLNISDIVTRVNKGYASLHRDTAGNGAEQQRVGEMMRLITLQIRKRLELRVQRAQEKAFLEAQEDLHVCWDEDMGLVEVGVGRSDGMEDGGETIVQVLLDDAYPEAIGCMQVMDVLPTGGLSVQDLQLKIHANGILTVTQLVTSMR